MNSNYSKKHRTRGHERRLSVRSQLRKEPDMNKIARTVIALAMAQAEKEAEEAARQERKSRDES